MINAVLYSAISLFSGRPLYDILPEMRMMFDLMKTRGQEGALAIFCPHMQTVLNFVGDVSDPLVLTGEALNEELAIQRAIAEDNTTLLLCIYLFKSMLAVHLNNFEVAQKYLKLLLTLDQIGMSPYGKHEQIFLQAITAVALSKGSMRLRSAKRQLKKLKKQELQAPANIKHKRLLIEAEIEVRNGDLQMAREKYDQAIETAENEGFLHDCAYACERAGYTMRRTNKAPSDYFLRATKTYSRWGSFLKANATRELVDKGNSCSASCTAMEDGSIEV
jgi:tetratricopeptide (TPR) repeat protein